MPEESYSDSDTQGTNRHARSSSIQTGRMVKKPETCMKTSFHMRDLKAERCTVSCSAMKLNDMTKAMPIIDSADSGAKSIAWPTPNKAAHAE